MKKWIIAPGNASKELANRLGNELGTNILDIETKLFHDGESKITIQGNVNNKNVILLQSTYPPTDRHILQLIFMAHNIYKNGVLIDITNNIMNYWNDNLVTFLLGCSNSFEYRILEENIRLKHIEKNKCVAMYKTNIITNKTEYFRGNLVVSMRLIKECDIEKVINITENLPLYHGSPIHIGNPNDIGIIDITKPDWGDYIKSEKDDIEVFWACGVTVKTVIEESKPEFAITHEPGCMFVTDLIN